MLTSIALPSTSSRCLIPDEYVGAGDDDLQELIDEYLEWLGRRMAERPQPICPRCARWAQDPKSPLGWCATCTTERQIEIDARNEREKARKRRWWASSGREWDRSRGVTSHHRKPADD